MNAITTDMTMNFTKELDLLYVEDDLELQEETKSFFDLLFHSVTVVSNGVDALTIYKKKAFDLVISDTKMPKMDGIELTTKIREINQFQNIIIISAYNETADLLKYINLNIRQFIQKPIDFEKILESLYTTAKSIVNEKMIEEYRASLEESNKELTEKNKELNSLVRILDSKISQIAKTTTTELIETDISEATIAQEHLEELKELEIDIDGAAVLIGLSKNLNISNIQVLGDMFEEYSRILIEYDTYTELASEIHILAATLSDEPQNFLERVEETTILLESFIYVLRLWREKVLQKEYEKALELHVSMINDVQTIIGIVNGTQDEIETEMEFF